MFKSTRILINALTEKTSAKKGLELYDISGNNPVPLASNTMEKQELSRLVDNRKENIKVYTRNMAELIGKRALFAAPIIIGGLTIASFVNGKYTKTINATSAYQTVTLEFDEESLLTKDETIYAHSCFSHDYVDKDIKRCGHYDHESNSSYATIYYGEGSNSLQVMFNINNDSTWRYNSHTNNLYQRSETSVKEPIGEINETYKELIKEAAETFIKQADLTDEEKEYVREIISNNENDILVKIHQCVDLSGMEMEVNKFHWFRCIVALAAGISVVYTIISNFEEVSTVSILENEYSLLRKRYSTINILKAAKQYREKLEAAEIYRLSSIVELLKDNGADETVIKSYEKRLALSQHKTLNNLDD